jgi:hypothetical protein
VLGAGDIIFPGFSVLLFWYFSGATAQIQPASDSF